MCLCVCVSVCVCVCVCVCVWTTSLQWHLLISKSGMRVRGLHSGPVEKERTQQAGHWQLYFTQQRCCLGDFQTAPWGPQLFVIKATKKQATSTPLVSIYLAHLIFYFILFFFIVSFFFFFLVYFLNFKIFNSYMRSQT